MIYICCISLDFHYVILGLQLIDDALLTDLFLCVSILFVYHSVIDLLGEDKNACKQHT